MATLRRGLGLAMRLGFAAALASCGDLRGFGGSATPLATIKVEVQGSVPDAADMAGREPALRVALVWGDQWLPEPFCILPPADEQTAAVVAAGCRDPFGFVPKLVAANAGVEQGRATLELLQLPSAEVMVGDLTARVAYGSLVVYDDRDGDGTLRLDRARRLRGRQDDGPPDSEDMRSVDVVYGASFVSMTEPDTRVAYREGGFRAQAAFYPRNGCGDPPPAFSLLSAGGFSALAVLDAIAMGGLPPEDPAQCRQSLLDETVVIRLRPSAELRGVGCEQNRTDGSTRYREPPEEAPDLEGRSHVCAEIPTFQADLNPEGGEPQQADDAPPQLQWVVSGNAADTCVGLTHFALRGCFEDVRCALPEWDLTSNPPQWWPCRVQAP